METLQHLIRCYIRVFALWCNKTWKNFQ